MKIRIMTDCGVKIGRMEKKSIEGRWTTEKDETIHYMDIAEIEIPEQTTPCYQRIEIEDLGENSSFNKISLGIASPGNLSFSFDLLDGRKGRIHINPTSLNVEFHAEKTPPFNNEPIGFPEKHILPFPNLLQKVHRKKKK